VKEVATDLHLFMEEFMTKMAEYYPEKSGNGSSQPDTLTHHAS
jgi:hypothetical protein